MKCYIYIYKNFSIVKVFVFWGDKNKYDSETSS